MFALITEVALGYTLSIPEWLKILFLFSLILFVPLLFFRIIKFFSDL